MKTRISSLLVVLLITAILLGTPGAVVQAAPVQARGRTPLSQAEIDGLLFVREEEKLAHDVYVVMYAKWGQTIFSNISSSESNHMAATKTLLDRYGLPDPAKGNALGEFTNPVLQILYDDLVAQGNLSLADALLVGGFIEEFDILDIEAWLAATSHADILNVYNNLVDGSCNHLRAFSSTYQRMTGQVYTPQLLDKGIYQAIINGTY